MFRSVGFHHAHTVLWRQLGVVAEIIMIVVVVVIIVIIMATATVIGCFLSAVHCSKHFTDLNSFNLRNSPTDWVLVLSPF